MAKEHSRAPVTVTFYVPLYNCTCARTSIRCLASTKYYSVEAAFRPQELAQTSSVFTVMVLLKIAELGTEPLIHGSAIYAVLTLVGLVITFLLRAVGVIPAKELGSITTFVITTGVCLWSVWASAWMVSTY